MLVAVPVLPAPIVRALDCADLIVVKSFGVGSCSGSEPLIEASEQSLRLGFPQAVEQCAEQDAAVSRGPHDFGPRCFFCDVMSSSK